MDNLKMGELIRETRKEKKLTQKDVADKLGITDRAVSKWERGICAPDLAYIEDLADILGITVAELIAGERMAQPPSEEVEDAVKETIFYSRNELNTKNKNLIKTLVAAGVTVIILCLIVFLGRLWYAGYFHIIDTFSSPDGTLVTTVYDCILDAGPMDGGFTMITKGNYNNIRIYQNATYNGVWWSQNSRYCVVSMDWVDGVYLALTDYRHGSTANLTLILEQVLVKNDFFADVAHAGDSWSPLVSLDFIQWSDVDPNLMLVSFVYTDQNGDLQKGYIWYNYETYEASGYMKIDP